MIAKFQLPLTMAPMVGLSHVAFRDLVRHYTDAPERTWWPTEMLNSRRLPSEDLAENPYTRLSESDVNIHPQILGNEQGPIQQSIKKLEQTGIVGIDINMGCPVAKALKHNYGVALMGDADYAARVVEFAASATSLPVSVKLRAGDQGDPSLIVRFVQGLKNSGASWITLHPRKAEQQRRGTADWNQIRLVKREVNLPVVGNGDIQTVEDIEQMFLSTQCDAVMVGRALTARPWLFYEYAKKCASRDDYEPLTPSQEGKMYLESLKLMIDFLELYFEESIAVRKFQFHVRVGHVWLDFGHHIMSVLSAEKTFGGLRDALERLNDSFEFKMNPRTNLRY